MTDALIQETEALLATVGGSYSPNDRRLLRRWLQHDQAQRERLEAAEAVCEAAEAFYTGLCTNISYMPLDAALAKWEELRDA